MVKIEMKIRGETCVLKFMKILREMEYIVLYKVRYKGVDLEDKGTCERSGNSGDEVHYLSCSVQRWVTRRRVLYIRGLDGNESDSTVAWEYA